VPSGYSGKGLVQRLGIRPGEAIRLVDPPRGYLVSLGELPNGASLIGDRSALGFVQFFARRKADLEEGLPRLERKLKEDGVIWVSWPKRSSSVDTDLTDAVEREVGLESGLVDVKVCSIDETWSALKFVRRRKDRHVSPKVD
jgi:hypothetical protein